MQIKSPIAIFNQFQQRKIEKEEAGDIFKQRLEDLFLKTNREEMIILTKKLSERKVSAKELEALTRKAAENLKAFKKQQLITIHKYKGKTLDEIKDESLFSRLLIILRDLYAQDIASLLPCSIAIDIVLDNFLFHK